MILELSIEGISLNVLIFKPFSYNRRIKRCGAYFKILILGAALIRGWRLIEGGGYWRKYGIVIYKYNYSNI